MLALLLQRGRHGGDILDVELPGGEGRQPVARPVLAPDPPDRPRRARQPRPGRGEGGHEFGWIDYEVALDAAPGTLWAGREFVERQAVRERRV